MIGHRNSKFRDDFELTKDELNLLVDSRRNEHGVKGSLARATNKVASLEQLGIGVRRNKNGDFDGRSKLGKKLNKELPRARAMEFRYQNELAEIQSEISRLNGLPKSRASDWAAAESGRLANRIILPFFAITLVLAAVSKIPLSDYWIWLGVSWLVILAILKRLMLKSLVEKLHY